MKRNLSRTDTPDHMTETQQNGERLPKTVKGGRNKRKKRGSVLRLFVLVFLLVVIITGAVSAAISYQSAMKSVTSSSSDIAYSVSVILSELYSTPQSSGGLLQGSSFRQDERIRQIGELLHYLCKDMELEYLYVFDLDEEGSNYLYYFIAAADDAADAKVQQERGFGTIVHVDPIPDSVREAYHGSTDVKMEHLDNQYGETYSWTYPLKDDADTVQYLVGVEFDAGDIRQDVWRGTWQTSVPILAVLLVVMLIMMLIIRRKVLNPLQKVSVRMNHFIDDNEHNEPLTLKVNNEVGEIADAFNKMRTDINSYLSEINTLTTERVQQQTQMDIARRIQGGIVPEKTDQSTDRYQVCAVEQPCKEVGGDFYDCFLRGEDELCLVVGDVSGKGVTAALFMVMTKTAIREKLMSGLSPAEVLNTVNDEICQANPEGLFATVFVAVLYLKTGRLSFANAGHTPPVFLREKVGMGTVDAGIAIGLFEEAGIQEDGTLLSPGEGLLLYTDGVTEAVDPQNHFFGEQRLLQALEGVSDASQATQAVQTAVGRFYNGRETFDDLTILSVFCRETAVTRTLRPSLEELPVIKECLMALTEDSGLLKRTMLVCDEVFTNIVSYAEATAVSFTCEWEEDGITLLFSDNGKPFDPLQEPDTDKDFDDWDTGGMGLLLVKQTASHLFYQRRSGENRLLLTVRPTKEG